MPGSCHFTVGVCEDIEIQRYHQPFQALSDSFQRKQQELKERCKDFGFLTKLFCIPHNCKMPLDRYQFFSYAILVG